MNNHIQTAISEQGIEAYLHAQQHKSLLRFLTCGSVDDGKSTLIGRLLHDSQQIYEDQLKALESDSQKLGTTGEKLDLALLVDGLQAEREQGITIDVAYRYFSTAKRKFIISDTPGHEQYTRNMATGASTCDLAIILIDARKGVLDQTRRHSFIVSLLGIKQFVVAVNKMDLVEFSQEVFDRIKPDLVVLSPGPGSPKDFDCKATIKKARARNLPIFGVCLGLQALAEAYGGELRQLAVPMHGKPSRIRVLEPGVVFSGLGREVTVGRYHSIFADPATLPRDFIITAESEDGTIMGIEHASEPVAAVQFHPESIMTLGQDAGMRMIENVVAHLSKKAKVKAA